MKQQDTGKIAPKDGLMGILVRRRLPGKSRKQDGRTFPSMRWITRQPRMNHTRSWKWVNAERGALIAAAHLQAPNTPRCGLRSNSNGQKLCHVHFRRFHDDPTQGSAQTPVNHLWISHHNMMEGTSVDGWRSLMNIRMLQVRCVKKRFINLSQTSGFQQKKSVWNWESLSFHCYSLSSWLHINWKGRIRTKLKFC